MTETASPNRDYLTIIEPRSWRQDLQLQQGRQTVTPPGARLQVETGSRSTHLLEEVGRGILSADVAADLIEGYKLRMEEYSSW